MVQYTTQEAVSHLGISFITLKRWIYAGKIKAVRDKRGWWRIEEEEIERVRLVLSRTKEKLSERILALVSAKKVAYHRELQVCREEEFLYEETNAALQMLRSRGDLNTMRTVTRMTTNDLESR